MRIRFTSMVGPAPWEGTAEEWFDWVAMSGAVLGRREDDNWVVSVWGPGYASLVPIGAVRIITEAPVMSARAGVRETSQLGTTGPVRTPVDSTHDEN